MSIFPTITKKKQEFYEKIYLKHTDLNNHIPEICGYYGRACRRMDDKADRILCQGCTLSIFISTVNEILKCCDKKAEIGIKRLYDSDIYDIQEELNKKALKVDFSYIEKVLDYLIE